MQIDNRQIISVECAQKHSAEFRAFQHISPSIESDAILVTANWISIQFQIYV